MTAIAPSESRALPGLPIPDAVHYPDTGFRRDTYAVRLFEAHGYDTGGDPFYSAETVRALLAQLPPAAPQVVAWRWPGGHWDDGEPTARDEAELARVGVKPEFAYSAPPAAPQVPEGMAERIEAALQRIVDGHCIRRIPADPTEPDLVLAEVLAFIQGKPAPAWIRTPPAPEQPKPAGDVEADAARYRWMKQARLSVWVELASSHGGDLDAAIDATRLAAQPAQGEGVG